MSWHIGPPREHTGLDSRIIQDWHRIISREAAEAATRWRLDSYITCVNAPVEIADTFLDEWLEGLWRTNLK